MILQARQGKLERKRFIDWVCFTVSYESRNFHNLKVSKFYKKAERTSKRGRGDFYTDDWFYISVFFYPFFKLYDFLFSRWMLLGRFFRRRGYLNVKENVSMGYFWPKRLRFKKRSNLI